MEEKTNVLEVRDLSVSYTVANVKTHVLEGVSFDVEKGKSVGIVGESGCGKTTTLRTILNVLPSNGTIESGEILYEGENILEMPKARLQEYRQKGAGMIFQDPSSALNPVISIKNQFLEALKYAHKDKKLTKTELLEKAAKSLETVSLADPDRILNSYPFQLSGGMRQRVCIAMTMAAQRQLLLADEPGDGSGRDDTGPDPETDQEPCRVRRTVGCNGDPFPRRDQTGDDVGQYYVRRHDRGGRGDEAGI